MKNNKIEKLSDTKMEKRSGNMKEFYENSTAIRNMKIYFKDKSIKIFLINIKERIKYII